MKFLIFTILLSLLLATCVSSYRFTRLGQYFEDATTKCDNITFWQSFLDKAKKEHPTADTRDLVKFMAHDIMNDPSNASFVIVVHKKAGKYFFDTRFTYYIDFYGSFEEIQTLSGYFSGCNIRQEYIFMKISRNPSLETADFSSLKNNLLFKNNKFGFDFILEKRIHPIFEMIGNNFANFESNCTKLPKAETIIEKINNMTLSNEDEWTRLCTDEVKKNLKSIHSFIAKNGYNDHNISVISEGDETALDILYCYLPFDDPRCKTYCQMYYPTSAIVLNYIAN